MIWTVEQELRKLHGQWAETAEKSGTLEVRLPGHANGLDIAGADDAGSHDRAEEHVPHRQSDRVRELAPCKNVFVVQNHCRRQRDPECDVSASMQLQGWARAAMYLLAQLLKDKGAERSCWPR